MTVCTGCGHQLGVGRFCTNCGAPVDPDRRAGGRTGRQRRRRLPTDAAARPRTAAAGVHRLRRHRATRCSPTSSFAARPPTAAEPPGRRHRRRSSRPSPTEPRADAPTRHLHAGGRARVVILVLVAVIGGLAGSPAATTTRSRRRRADEPTPPSEPSPTSPSPSRPEQPTRTPPPVDADAPGRRSSAPATAPPNQDVDGNLVPTTPPTCSTASRRPPGGCPATAPAMELTFTLRRADRRSRQVGPDQRLRQDRRRRRGPQLRLVPRQPPRPAPSSGSSTTAPRCRQDARGDRDAADRRRRPDVDDHDGRARAWSTVSSARARAPPARNFTAISEVVAARHPP